MLIAALALAAFATGDGVDVAPITPTEFARLHGELVEKRPARWQTIPWKVDLLAARAESIKSKRPLMIWAMNGHPLGCT